MFVPPCPGDEGVAVGCAAFGWHQRRLLLPSDGASGAGGDEPTPPAVEEEGSTAEGGNGEAKEAGAAAEEEEEHQRPIVGSGALRAPFWGRGWSKDDVEDEIAEWESWVDVRDVEGVEVKVKIHACGYKSWCVCVTVCLCLKVCLHCCASDGRPVGQNRAAI